MYPNSAGVIETLHCVTLHNDHMNEQKKSTFIDVECFFTLLFQTTDVL